MQASGPTIVPNSSGLEIDPALNPAAMAAAFEQFGRIHIPGFLNPAGAEMLHTALTRESDWLCSTMGSGQTIDVSTDMLNAMEPARAMRFLTLAHAEARDGFHYMFDTVRISDRVEKGQPLTPALAAAYDFLNSPAFLDFVRTLTGDRRPANVDAQATRYEQGHYLTEHDDKKPESGRLYAYVLNLTPHWRTDWGGLLTFTDDEGHLSQAYRPAWNALNLFRVPQKHAVSCVAPFAGASRLSITGWVRERPASPPARAS